MKILKRTLQLMFVALGVYLWKSIYKEFSWEDLSTGWRDIQIKWIFLAGFCHLVNHLLRAYRWKVLLGHSIGLRLRHTFVAEMGGFCVNVLVTRLGEYFRCLMLRRLAGVTISRALASVVVERVLDIGFLSLIVITVCFTGSPVISIVQQAWAEVPTKDLPFHSYWLIGGLSVIAIVTAVLFFSERYSAYRKRLRAELLSFVRGLGEVRRTASLRVFALTLLIFFFHFLVEYFCLFTLDETSNLSLYGALCLFLAINIGMVTPAPGGVGFYHLLVKLALQSFAVGSKKAILYATITHAIQMFNALVVGGACCLLYFYMTRKRRDLPNDDLQSRQRDRLMFASYRR